ncbi:type II toxin-antitoxin system RatA family toxin [Sulfuriflexus sp.]|uniref:type II toxin-antitoxin system RatA family toxin n=1 Tax=Sulfuriflexus sp. TaxID=2015443 RepID=UPI0028CD5851|nr:type II toxin-antitoxin system RatA family toxin [Sulfuriflexus sp.]MDT8404829.1 type II toxin-antitoxin system RatA family toxin [Sulfuriflexus sp.]
MPVISKSALVPYSAAEMFALVNDIPAYPDFLPWCGDSEILASNEDEIRAKVQLSRSGIKKSFTTLNRLQKDKMIEMRLVEGPFQHLEGFWRFEPLNDTACKVMFDIEFEFSSKILALTVGPVFSQITSTLVDAFTKRAVEIYGKR